MSGSGRGDGLTTHDDIPIGISKLRMGNILDRGKVQFAWKRLTQERVLDRERLQTSEPEVAERNLRDLARLNRWFGGHRVLLRILRRLVSPSDRFSVLDIGAASGDSGKLIVRRYANSSVVSLDRQMLHLRTALSPRVVADASALPFSERSFDFVLCSLLLHHFSHDSAVAYVTHFQRYARRAVIIIDVERHLAAYIFLPLTRLVFRWSDLTVHDGCASVAAGFKPSELVRIAEHVGARGAVVWRHWPWFRMSVVIPARLEMDPTRGPHVR